VVAAAVILPSDIDYKAHPWLKNVHDSKLVPEEARLELAPLIEGWALASAIAIATVEEIDRINIYHASHLAMCRAIEKLGAVDHVLVDGNAVPKALKCAATPIVKGDQKCLSIAAASILAKVWRDNHMNEMEAAYPGYGFARHKGYPTPMHIEALQKLGYCPVHRRSFAPVQHQVQIEFFC
jgi:ribonuclease HII